MADLRGDIASGSVREDDADRGPRIVAFDEQLASAVAEIEASSSGEANSPRASEVQIEAVEPAPPPLDVAIVGLACLLPGATDSITYWNNILESRDTIGEVPLDRFDAERWFDANPAARDKIYSKWGGFLPDILFDPLKYGIPPAALRASSRCSYWLWNWFARRAR